MQSEEYRKWLVDQGYQTNTISAQMHRASRVENCYGDLDEHFAKDGLNGVIGALTYSRTDQRNNRPNETKIPFEGDAYNNLASYRDAVRRYMRFLEGRPEIAEFEAQIEPAVTEPIPPQTIGLEKDLQAAIRCNIAQLEDGLSIVDGGREAGRGGIYRYYRQRLKWHYSRN